MFNLPKVVGQGAYCVVAKKLIEPAPHRIGDGVHRADCLFVVVTFADREAKQAGVKDFGAVDDFYNFEQCNFVGRFAQAKSAVWSFGGGEYFVSGELLHDFAQERSRYIEFTTNLFDANFLTFFAIYGQINDCPNGIFAGVCEHVCVFKSCGLKLRTFW